MCGHKAARVGVCAHVRAQGYCIRCGGVSLYRFHIGKSRTTEERKRKKKLTASQEKAYTNGSCMDVTNEGETEARTGVG
eukprot:6614744-Pyramimonas_sp.AAC.1